MRRLGFAAGAVLALVATAARSELPEPLTLGDALRLAAARAPAVAAARAGEARAQARAGAEAAALGAELRLEGRLRWIEPVPGVSDPGPDDHALYLRGRRLLADGGRRRARLEAARADADGAAAAAAAAVQQARLAAARAFFDVLLADLAYARDTEAMTMAFLRLDRLRARSGRGLVSEVELARAEAVYRAALARREAAVARQRRTRERLALLLGAPGEPPADLEAPRLESLRRKPPEDPKELVERALAAAPQVALAEARVAAARRRLAAAEAGTVAVFAEAELAAHSREMGSRDRARAGLRLELPLYDGGRRGAERAAARAALAEAEAALAQTRAAVRERVLTLWEELVALAGQRRAALAELDYRDLYLDRARALYEQGQRADLGDAMVRISAARHELARVEYAMALAWMELAALTGTGGGDWRP